MLGFLTPFLMAIPGAGPIMAFGSMLFSPAGRAIMIVVGVAAGGLWIDHHARVDEREKLGIATLHKQIETLQRDIKNVKDAEIDANKRAEDLAKTDEIKSGRLKELEDAVANAPKDTACLVTPDRRRRLRKLTSP